MLDIGPTANCHLKTAIQMVILYSSEIRARDVHFLAQDCQTSKDSVQDCIYLFIYLQLFCMLLKLEQEMFISWLGISKPVRIARGIAFKPPGNVPG